MEPNAGVPADEAGVPLPPEAAKPGEGAGEPGAAAEAEGEGEGDAGLGGLADERTDRTGAGVGDAAVTVGTDGAGADGAGTAGTVGAGTLGAGTVGAGTEGAGAGGAGTGGAGGNAVVTGGRVGAGGSVGVGAGSDGVVTETVGEGRSSARPGWTKTWAATRPPSAAATRPVVFSWNTATPSG